MQVLMTLRRGYDYLAWGEESQGRLPGGCEPNGEPGRELGRVFQAEGVTGVQPILTVEETATQIAGLFCGTTLALQDVTRLISPRLQVVTW